LIATSRLMSMNSPERPLGRQTIKESVGK